MIPHILWQGRSLMSFLQSTYVKPQQDLHYSTTWCGSQFMWRNTSQLFNYPSFPFLHPGPREVEPHPGQHLLRCEEHTRLSWSYSGWWWWSSCEETSPWSQGTVDYRRLHQGLVTTTWHGLRFRTSGGGAYSPSSNLVVSSVQSCRGCRRNSKMPLTKSPKDVSSENHDFTLSVYIFSSNFYFSTFNFNSLSIHLVPSRWV